MKKLLVMLIAVIGMSTAAIAGDKVKTVDIKTKINCDHCKLCGSCSKRLETALYDMKGIKRVDIDDKEMNIKVSFNIEKTTLEDIRNTIANTGYDADDVKAPAEAFAKLDGCCRGEE